MANTDVSGPGGINAFGQDDGGVDATRLTTDHAGGPGAPDLTIDADLHVGGIDAAHRAQPEGACHERQTTETLPEPRARAAGGRAAPGQRRTPGDGRGPPRPGRHLGLIESDVASASDLRWLLPMPWVAAGAVGLVATAPRLRGSRD